MFTIVFACLRYCRLVRVDKKAVPSEINCQIRTVAFNRSFTANFDKKLTARAYYRKNEQDNAILIRLRVNPKAGFRD
jgi:hypothetical protein